MSAATVGPHYHVGIIVPDLPAAQARLTELLGVTWGPVLDVPAYDLRDGDGNDIVLPTKLCYSVGAPQLELIEETPGSVWVCNDVSNLHHIGFWTGELVAGSAALSAAGCPLQLCGRAWDQAPVSFSYHRDPLGIRIELIDEALQPVMESMLFGPADEGPDDSTKSSA
jgi:catechol 2,3-dioxygenase-like lactoylglutathione lyase family enzyme